MLYRYGLCFITPGNFTLYFLFVSYFVASEWNSSLFEDASKLLSVFSNVESAEMPEDMDKLGDQIIRHAGELKHIIEEFLDVSPQKALEWLRENDKVSQALDVFFEKHGHRGFAEVSKPIRSDIISIPLRCLLLSFNLFTSFSIMSLLLQITYLLTFLS